MTALLDDPIILSFHAVYHSFSYYANNADHFDESYRSDDAYQYDYTFDAYYSDDANYSYDSKPLVSKLTIPNLRLNRLLET